MMTTARHLWVALSPHGYGHVGMTAPVVTELRRRRPDLRLTVQTALPRDFLAERLGSGFDHVPDIPDFGLRMVSATEVAVEESAAAYARLHADWPAAVAQEAARLAAARPDLVLANIPYVTIAAARQARIRVAALSSLNWADVYRTYLGGRPEAPGIAAQMTAAYNDAEVFLRVTPAMAMPHFTNLRDIGPAARRGRDRRDELAACLGVGGGKRIGLIAFGGIALDLPLDTWPRLEGWVWVTTLAEPAERADIFGLERAGMPFTDVLASASVVVTKVGYGTFVEAALVGAPVLFEPRPEWPESEPFALWLMRHTRAAPTGLVQLFEPAALAEQLHKLFSLPSQSVAEPTGVGEAVDLLERMLDGEGIACERS